MQIEYFGGELPSDGEKESLEHAVDELAHFVSYLQNKYDASIAGSAVATVTMDFIAFHELHMEENGHAPDIFQSFVAAYPMMLENMRRNRLANKADA